MHSVDAEGGYVSVTLNPELVVWGM